MYSSTEHGVIAEIPQTRTASYMHVTQRKEIPATKGAKGLELGPAVLDRPSVQDFRLLLRRQYRKFSFSGDGVEF